MLTIVYGASASGKSEFAETLFSEFSKPLVYVATMIPFGEEAFKRIEKHKFLRHKKGFSTIECPQNIGNIDLENKSSILIECMGNLVANELFNSEYKEEISKKIIIEIEELMKRTTNIVIVTNDVFSDGKIYSEETFSYMRALAQVNAELFLLADNVYEICYSIPIILKGGEK